jgi:two-component system sensor kinase FixL
VSRGEVDAGPVRLTALLSDAIALSKVSRERADIPVTVAVDRDADRVLADPIQVQQVVINLIRNAMDAMTGQGDARIDIRAALLEPVGLVEVEVCDNGPGLSAEMKDSVFKPFATTKAHGMGLGLSICQTIVEAHGGTIRAIARTGGGTCFRFTLREDKDKLTT